MPSDSLRSEAGQGRRVQATRERPLVSARTPRPRCALRARRSRRGPRRVLAATVVSASVGCSDPAAPQGSDVGCPGASYPNWSTSPYVLPYPLGATHGVDLSNCSGSYHSATLPHAFATDFAMSIGTHVTVARDGTVVYVEERGRTTRSPTIGS